MKTIINIARTELRTLFYSPIAWFLLIVFFIQCSVVYFNQLSRYAITQEISGELSAQVSSLTYGLFVGFGGLFEPVLQNLYLYIPLLTMSLISRETGSGTIMLLFSSPVKVSEIVFGKFLAMMMYSLLLVLVISVFIVSGFYHIAHPDTGMLLSAMLGFYLLLCAYASIGLFMSCLTTYQVVAAIATFLMIGILSYVGSLWQGVTFVRELTYYLAMNQRTGNMIEGLITSKDLIYFGLIILMFLSFAMLKLRSGMESVAPLTKSARYFGVFAVVLIVGYISSMPRFVRYFDATANKSRTIVPRIQQILADMKDAPLTVTAYNNLLGLYWDFGGPESYNAVQSRWEPYMRFNPGIELKNVIYYDSVLEYPQMMKGYPGKTLKDIAEQTARSRGLDITDFKTPEEIRAEINLQPELNRYVMRLNWKGRSEFLRVFDDNRVWPGETEVAAVLKRLQRAAIPKIYFLTGDLERNTGKLGGRDYKQITTESRSRYALMNQGFGIDTVSLEQGLIPEDLSILVIADPRIAFSNTALEKLREFIGKGGNLLMAGEPGKQSLLNPLLQEVGVKMLDGRVIQQSENYEPDLAAPYVTPEGKALSIAFRSATGDSDKVNMLSAAALSFSDSAGFVMSPLLMTDARVTWNKLRPLDSNAVSAAFFSGSSIDQPQTTILQKAVVKYSPEDGDVRGPLCTAVALSRKLGQKEQRIIITGDADFLSNRWMQQANPAAVNFAFSTAVFSWLNYGEYPIDATRPKAKDTMVTVSTKKLQRLKIIYSWMMPAALALLGGIILIRRKRR